MEDTNPRFRAKVSVEVIDMRRKDHQEKWGDRAKEFQKSVKTIPAIKSHCLSLLTSLRIGVIAITGPLAA